jgi:hypothetical protein
MRSYPFLKKFFWLISQFMLISQIKRFKMMDTSWEEISTLRKAPNNTVNNLCYSPKFENLSEMVNN